MKNYHTFFLPFLAAIFVLSGCTVINPGPPPTLYTLSPQMPQKEHAPTLPCQLAVSAINTSPDIATRRIAVRPTSNEIRYFSKVSWVESAPDYVKRLQIEALESTGRFEAVSDDMADFLPNYRLSLELRDFSVHYVPKPVVEISLAVRIINLKNGKSVGFLRVDKKQPTSDTQFNDIIAAFNDALGAVLQDVSQWTVTRFEELANQQ